MPSSASSIEYQGVTQDEYSRFKLSEFEIAKHEWPTIDWPEADYRAHVKSFGTGTKHFSDLYAAGAAGYRMESAWEAIQSTLSDPVCRILARVPTADFEIEDLWSETIAKLIEDEPSADCALPDGRKPSRMIRFRAQVTLLQYLITVAKRIAITRDRRKKPDLGLFAGENDAMPKDPSARRPDEEAADREVLKRLAPALSEAMARLSAKQRFLVVGVCGQGMKQKQAGALIGWSESKASRQLGEAKATLRSALEGVLGSDASPMIVQAWCVELEKILKSDASSGAKGV